MKIKIYIDFDGVILDTWNVIVQNYINKYNTEIINDDLLKKSMLELGWNTILNNSEEINNSFEKIHQLMINYDVNVITKVNSIEEEKAKKAFLNNKEIYNIIFVPYNLSKSDFVEPNDCILIDDDFKNLNDWEKKGGISILFNKYLENIDCFGNNSNNFTIIDDLSKIYDIIKTR